MAGVIRLEYLALYGSGQRRAAAWEAGLTDHVWSIEEIVGLY